MPLHGACGKAHSSACQVVCRTTLRCSRRLNQRQGFQGVAQRFRGSSCTRLGASNEQPGGSSKDGLHSPAQPQDISIVNEPTTADNDYRAFDAWFTLRTMLQLWGVLLGLGYAGVPLLAQLLENVMGTGEGLPQAAALCAVELGVLLAVRALLERRGASEEGRVLVPRLQWRWSVRDAAIGVGAGAGALAVNSALLALTGQGAAQPDATGEVAAILQQRDLLLAVLLYCGSALLAPAAEELAYRGFLLPSLQRVMPTPAAVCAVAVLFGAAHLQPEGLVQLTVVGGLLGGAAVATGGNLMAPTFGHMVYNSALFVDVLIAGFKTGS